MASTRQEPEDPHRARADQGQDDDDGEDVAQKAGAAAAAEHAAVDGREGAGEAARAAQGLFGQGEQDAADHHDVQHGRDGARAQHADRHVALRVDHLFAGARFELETDEQEDDAADHRQKAAHAGLEGGERRVSGRQTLFDEVGDDQDTEEDHGDGFDPGARVHHPLAVLERDDGDPDAHPHEGEADDRRGEPAQVGVVIGVHEEGVDGGDRHARQRAADPDRVGDPVEHGRDAGRQLAVGHAHPRVDAAFDRKGRGQLRADETVGQQKDEDEDHQPGDGLPQAEAGDAGDGVEADDRADAEEHEVPAPQHPLEFRLLLLELDAGHEASDRFRSGVPCLPRGAHTQRTWDAQRSHAITSGLSRTRPSRGDRGGAHRAAPPGRPGRRRMAPRERKDCR